VIEIKNNSFTISIGKMSKIGMHIFVTLIIVIIFFTDYLTGKELAFSIFYLLPITIAVIFGGKKSGYIYSVVSAATWITADILTNGRYSSIYIPLWNTIVRLSYFVFHTTILSSLLETNKTMHEMSQRDPLTNTANWRYFEEYANRQIKVAVRERKNISLVYMDVDNFKEINDKLGHSIGDEVLMQAANGMSKSIRPKDIVARLGGDEFAILLYDASKEETEMIINRMKENVDQEMKSRGWTITLSIGSVVFSILPSTIGPMIKRVDEVMYEVKKNGKDNVKIVNQYN